MKINSRYLSIVVILFLSLSALNCAKTKKQPVKEEHVGFLETYEGFSKDPEGKYNLIYINEDIDFSKYNKFYVESISIFVPEGSTLQEVPRKDLQRLVDYAEERIIKTYSQTWTLADGPGPDVFAERIAVTQLGAGNRLGDTVTTVVPAGRAFSELRNLVTGKHSFVGQIAHEAEVIDSLTSERIVGVIGVRSGGKTFKFSTDKYKDAKNAIDLWVDNGYEKLLALRQADMKK